LLVETASSTVSRRVLVGRDSIVYREPPGACWSTSTSSSERARRNVNSGHVYSVTSGHVYSLWPFTNITAQIRVLNAKYEGAASESVAFVTAEGGTVRYCGVARWLAALHVACEFL